MATVLLQFFGAARHPCVEVSAFIPGGLRVLEYTGVVVIKVPRVYSPGCIVNMVKDRQATLHATLVSRFSPLWSMEGGLLSLWDEENCYTGINPCNES